MVEPPESLALAGGQVTEPGCHLSTYSSICSPCQLPDGLSLGADPYPRAFVLTLELGISSLMTRSVEMSLSDVRCNLSSGSWQEQSRPIPLHPGKSMDNHKKQIKEAPGRLR